MEANHIAEICIRHLSDRWRNLIDVGIVNAVNPDDVDRLETPQWSVQFWSRVALDLVDIRDRIIDAQRVLNGLERRNPCWRKRTQDSLLDHGNLALPAVWLSGN